MSFDASKNNNSKHYCNNQEKTDTKVLIPYVCVLIKKTINLRIAEKFQMHKPSRCFAIQNTVNSNKY